MTRLVQRFTLAAGVASVLSMISAITIAATVAPASATVATAASATTATAAAPASPGSMLQVIVGLLLVLGLLAAIAWSMKKVGAGKHGGAGAIRVVGGLPVGSRERIMVIEVADQWIVVGVTPTSITALSTMPKQEGAAPYSALPPTKNFSTWLQQTIDKRQAATNKSSPDSNHGTR